MLKEKRQEKNPNITKPLPCYNFWRKKKTISLDLGEIGTLKKKKPGKVEYHKFCSNNTMKYY